MCLWPDIGFRIGKENWRRESDFLAWAPSVSIQGHVCQLEAPHTGRTCTKPLHQHYCIFHAVCLTCKEQYELVGLLRSPGNRFFVMFMTHPTSSWSGICVSTVFSSLVGSKSVWTALLENWVSERGAEETWVACVDSWCLFEKYPFKSNPRWTCILKSDLHPKLQKIFSWFGLLQIPANCNGSSILKIASYHLLLWLTEAVKAVFLSLTLFCSPFFPFVLN